MNDNDEIHNDLAELGFLLLCAMAAVAVAVLPIFIF